MKVVLLIITQLVLIQYSWSNSHEHLTYLPSHDDLILTLAEQRASELGIEKRFSAANVSEAVEFILQDRGSIRDAFIALSELIRPGTRLTVLDSVFDEEFRSRLAEGITSDLRAVLAQKERMISNIQNQIAHLLEELGLPANQLGRAVNDPRFRDTLAARELRELRTRLTHAESELRNIMEQLVGLSARTPTLEGLHIRDILRGKSLGELLGYCSRGGQNLGVLLKSFLQIPAESGEGMAHYLGVTDVRNRIFNHLASLRPSRSVDFFVRPFEHFARRAAIEERSRLDLSVPYNSNNYTGREYAQRLRRIQSVLAEGVEDAQISFQFSIPRRQLGEGESLLDDALSFIRRYGSNDFRLGIDIAGSVREGSDAMLASEIENLQSYRRRLRDLFSARIEVRLHAFEGSNSGPFYQALFGALEDTARSGNSEILDLSIGHIAHIDEADIRNFARLRSLAQEHGNELQISFEASIDSNRILHGVREERLLRTIELIDGAGFPVALGTDGAGIFGISEMQMYERLYQEASHSRSGRTSSLRALINSSGIHPRHWMNFVERRSSAIAGLCGFLFLL